MVLASAVNFNRSHSNPHCLVQILNTPNTPSKKITIFRIVAVLITITIFCLGLFPASSEIFVDDWHFIAHFAVYALLAVGLGLGWRNIKGIHLWLMVSFVGVLQEVAEMVTHHHHFELEDALTDSLGVLAGVLVLRWLSGIVGRQK